MAALPYPLPGDRQDEVQGDEREVHHDDTVVGMGEFDGVEFAGVELLEVTDAGIRAELGVQLGGADVDAGHVGDAALQEAVGETAG